MLHPSQFEINEAWIIFRLNDAPIQVEGDGDFNCIALMDAASCFIFGTDLFPVAAAEPTQMQLRRLLKDAHQKKMQWPKTILISRDEVSDLLSREAKKYGIDVVSVAGGDLHVFTDEARDGFAEWAEK